MPGECHASLPTGIEPGGGYREAAIRRNSSRLPDCEQFRRLYPGNVLPGGQRSLRPDPVIFRKPQPNSTLERQPGRRFRFSSRRRSKVRIRRMMAVAIKNSLIWWRISFTTARSPSGNRLNWSELSLSGACTRAESWLSKSWARKAGEPFFFLGRFAQAIDKGIKRFKQLFFLFFLTLLSAFQ